MWFNLTANKLLFPFRKPYWTEYAMLQANMYEKIFDMEFCWIEGYLSFRLCVMTLGPKLKLMFDQHLRMISDWCWGIWFYYCKTMNPLMHVCYIEIEINCDFCCGLNFVRTCDVIDLAYSLINHPPPFLHFIFLILLRSFYI